jgi:hypothetical protein
MERNEYELLEERATLILGSLTALQHTAMSSGAGYLERDVIISELFIKVSWSCVRRFSVFYHY